MKKGQATTFIILALVLVIGIITYFTFKNQSQKTFSQETDTIESFINQCLKNTAEEQINLIAIQGGEYRPSSYKSYLSYKIPYYSNGSDTNIPKITNIEGDISKAIKDNLPNCINNFDIFSNKGYQIEQKQITPITNIKDDEITIKLAYPISITKDEQSTTLESFQTTIISDLNKSHNIATRLLKEQENAPEWFPLSFISELAYNEGFYFETVDLDNDELLITIIFNKDSEQQSIYAFINKYNRSEDE
ncbi:hypothetical protein CMI42_02450 [Candidatus Pacearchaeota archaeon]|nr:hypothetical protein [Candidatus Pacearchaeota archaeon]|tara:strand:- start:754 stop:1497 length:744 start_codon:yes stop_codon:yes gene_type:complete